MQCASSLEAEPHWARATLVAGKSNVQRWTIDSERPSARLVVGREAPSDWVIESDAMEAQHLALHWNGEQLWIIPLGESFTLVDGAVLSEPLCITRTTWVELGGAVMIVDASWGRSASPSLSRLEGAARRLDRERAGEGAAAGGTYAPTQIYRRDAQHREALRGNSGAANPHSAQHDASSMNATVIASLAQLCEGAEGPARGVATQVAAPCLGAPARTPPQPHERDERTDPISDRPVSWRRSLREAFRRARRFPAPRRSRQRWVRLALMLGAGIAALPLIFAGELKTQVVRANQRVQEGVAPSPAERANAETVHGLGAIEDEATTPEGARRADGSIPVDRDELRRASELLIAGRYEQALPAYRHLQSATGERVYETILRVLERKLRERCEEREAQGGAPCSE